MKESYLARLAEVYWLHNHQVLQVWFRGRARNSWQDRHWLENERELDGVMIDVRSRVMPVAEPHFREVERLSVEARHAREPRFRDMALLRENEGDPLSRAVKEAERAIFEAAKAAIVPVLRAHARTLSQDPEWLESSDLHIDRHSYTYPGPRTPEQSRTRTLQGEISLSFIWSRPSTAAEMRQRTAGHLDDYVKNVLLEMHWNVDDPRRLGPRMLLGAMRQWITEIDRSVTVGMHLVTHHRITGAIDAATAWIAFTYGWSRYPYTCRRAGILQHIRAPVHAGNIAMPGPPIPPLLVQGRPPETQRPPRIMRGSQRRDTATQTTTAHLGRSQSI